MRKIDGGQRIYTILNKDVLSEVDRIARRQNISRADTIRKLLGFGVEVYSDFESVGVVHLVDAFSRARGFLKKEVGQQSLL